MLVFRHVFFVQESAHALRALSALVGAMAPPTTPTRIPCVEPGSEYPPTRVVRVTLERLLAHSSHMSFFVSYCFRMLCSPIHGPPNTQLAFRRRRHGRLCGRTELDM